MSVVSKNPFDLLGDDGDELPAPVVAKPAAPKKAEAPAPARDVPGAAAKPAATRGGRYPNRGGPRNVNRGGDEGDRNTGPTSSEGVAEGAEHPGGFDGERVAPSRKGNHIRDAHTKGPRGTRPAKNFTSGGHTSQGGHSGGRTPAQGGERRQFERRSGGLPDSQKKIEHGWGANDGEAELTAEVEGQQDAVVEENAAETAAPDADGETAQPAAEGDAPAEPEEPEEVQKSLDEYLAERASQALAFGKKEGRVVSAETLEGSEFRRTGIEEFFSAKNEKSAKAVKAKKEKVFIEVDGQFSTPPGGGDRSERGGRGGRGGDRGGRGGAGRGRGGFGGDGRGAPRGARGGRGGARGGRPTAAIDSNDTSAFPALGA